MRAMLAALLLLTPFAAQSQGNGIRAICQAPAPPNPPGLCPAQYPGQYAGGDSIYLWPLDSEFLMVGNGVISIKENSLRPQQIREDDNFQWTVTQNYEEITPPFGSAAGVVAMYAKAGAGMCSKDSGNTERCMQRSTALATPICTHLQNLAIGTDSFIAAIPNAGTLSKVWCITSGTIVTAPTIHLAECSSSGASCNDNTTSALTCNGSGASTTTFGGAGGSAIDADDWMQLNLTNTPSVTDGVTTFCLAYQPTP